MRFSVTLSVLAGLAATAQAHTTVFGLWVNGVFQGDGRNAYIRSPPNNSPVKDVTQASINCNVNNRAVPSSVSVKNGDTVTFEWFHDNRGDDIIDLSHKGPVTVWIADRASNGEGAVWTKLAEDGFSNGKWAVEKLVANGGKHDVKLPANLASGDYLLRAEIIALHEAETSFLTNPARGAQFYPSCSQITVTGTGNVKPAGNFNFVGGYTANTPGILFNIYTTVTSYPIPGPAVAAGGTAPAASSTKVAAPTTLVTSTKVASSTTVKASPTTTITASTKTATASVVVAPTAVTTTIVVRPTTTATVTNAPSGCVLAPSASAGTSNSLVQKYYQCGGANHTGSTKCAAGLTCTVHNPYYSQCL
ncbi:putative endo-beta-1,4-glucanase D [Peziza echinospora]|nr:putative endo-beta-1,4-glucanase D [Peziza echinospora]